MISIQKTAVGFVALALLAATPVLALEAGVSTGAGAAAGGVGVAAQADAKIELRITKAKERASQEIDRRIARLNELNTKVQAMTRVSATQKATVANTVSTEVASLTALKAKIQADTDLQTLKTNIQSITKSYRIFMLVIPQGRIEVAADKIMTVTGSLTTFAGKLKAKIDAAASAGKDVSTMTTSYNEMTASVADAKVQADAAVSLVANLKPDNGDKATMDANSQALRDAKAKIKAGLKAIDDARADARSIIKELKSLGLEANAKMNSEVQTAGNTQ